MIRLPLAGTTLPRFTMHITLKNQRKIRSPQLNPFNMPKEKPFCAVMTFMNVIHNNFHIVETMSEKSTESMWNHVNDVHADLADLSLTA
jgi:fatty acid/phospholipid biosynthesis enzyme